MHPSGNMAFVQRHINVDATSWPLYKHRVNVNTMSWSCIDVNATFYKRHVLARIIQHHKINKTSGLKYNNILHFTFFSYKAFFLILGCQTIVLYSMSSTSKSTWFNSDTTHVVIWVNCALNQVTVCKLDFSLTIWTMTQKHSANIIDLGL